MKLGQRKIVHLWRPGYDNTTYCGLHAGDGFAVFPAGELDVAEDKGFYICFTCRRAHTGSNARRSGRPA